MLKQEVTIKEMKEEMKGVCRICSAKLKAVL
jgi:hypothetical protein